jgi:hypothetical protein
MARSARKPAPPAASEAPATEAAPPPQPLRLDEHLRPAPARTRDEHELREALWAAVVRQQEAIQGFVAEKVGEGFTETEVHALYAVVTPLAPVAVPFEGRRPKVEWEVAFVERGQLEDDDGE